MKKFYFLEEHPLFTGKFSLDDVQEFYDFKNEKTDEITCISIPNKIGKELIWIYRKESERNDGIFKPGKEIEIIKNICPWFYELVREAEAALEKRDRIRKLFI